MQPTARSAPVPVRSTGTAPVEWHRSHWTSAPRACASAVIVAMSNIAPVRKSTWVRLSSATSSSTAASGSAGSHQRSSQAHQVGDPGGDVAVGGEGGRLHDEHVAVGPQPGRSNRGLEEAHARAVAEVQVATAYADQWCDPVGDPAADLHPAGVVPRADQAFAPLPAHHVLDPLGDTPRQRTERVPVEVDQPVGQLEAAHGLAGSSKRRSRARVSSARNVTSSMSLSPVGVKFTWAT